MSQQQSEHLAALLDYLEAIEALYDAVHKTITPNYHEQ